MIPTLIVPHYILVFRKTLQFVYLTKILFKKIHDG